MDKNVIIKRQKYNSYESIKKQSVFTFRGK